MKIACYLPACDFIYFMLHAFPKSNKDFPKVLAPMIITVKNNDRKLPMNSVIDEQRLPMIANYQR